MPHLRHLGRAAGCDRPNHWGEHSREDRWRRKKHVARRGEKGVATDSISVLISQKLEGLGGADIAPTWRGGRWPGPEIEESPLPPPPGYEPDYVLDRETRKLIGQLANAVLWGEEQYAQLDPRLQYVSLPKTSFFVDSAISAMQSANHPA